MSTTYNYYIALRDKETKKFEVFPGTTYKSETYSYSNPKEDKKYTIRLRSIYWRSGSFMPESFSSEFITVNEDDCSDELKEAFTFKNWDNTNEFSEVLGYITLDDLNKMDDDFVKTGYFLAEDVSKYEKNKEIIFDDEIFYDRLSPVVYANMCTKQIKTHTEKDCDGYEYTVHGFEDYMFYAYPDYDSKEYLIHELKIIMNSYQESIEYISEFKNKELVLLQDWG